MWQLPSRELTYPPQKGTFADDFPFPKVGYVNSLDGIFLVVLVFLTMRPFNWSQQVTVAPFFPASPVSLVWVAGPTTTRQTKLLLATGDPPTECLDGILKNDWVSTNEWFCRCMFITKPNFIIIINYYYYYMCTYIYIHIISWTILSCHHALLLTEFLEAEIIGKTGKMDDALNC